MTLHWHFLGTHNLPSKRPHELVKYPYKTLIWATVVQGRATDRWTRQAETYSFKFVNSQLHIDVCKVISCLVSSHYCENNQRIEWWINMHDKKIPDKRQHWLVHKIHLHSFRHEQWHKRDCHRFPLFTGALPGCHGSEASRLRDPNTKSIPSVRLLGTWTNIKLLQMTNR